MVDSNLNVLAAEKELESSAASSRQESLRKEMKEEKDEEASIENATPDPEDDGEYPSGMKMAAVVTALVLSIFLVSLFHSVIKVSN